jgi:hypothetical protein
VLKSVKTSRTEKDSGGHFKMFYIAAVEGPNKSGCIAIQKESEDSLIEFWDELKQLVGHKPIQIVAISRRAHIWNILLTT